MKRFDIIGMLLIVVVAFIWHQPQFLDFAAFSCAGQAVAHHADPYDKIGALALCEQHVIALTGSVLTPGEVLPAPLPPYALALFALFAGLPPFAAAVSWFVLLLISCCAIGAMLHRSTKLSYALILAATIIPIAWVSLEVAQITPIILALIVGTAVATNAGRPRLAALSAMLSMCEPHLGLPVCLALFCIERKARMMLAGGGLLLLVVSLIVMPAPLSMHYATVILPRHVHAEMAADAQLSLTHALALFGFPENTALTMGSLQYAVMVALGAWVAVRIARNASERDLAVLTAPTIAMLGGSFVHIHQIAIASCCALLLLRKQTEPNRMLDVAIILLAIPLIVARSPTQMLVYTCIAAVIVFERGYRPGVVMLAALATFVMIKTVYAFMSSRLLYLVPLEEARFIPHYNYGPDADIESVWHAFVAARFCWLGPISLIVQLPTLIALSTVCVAVIQRGLIKSRGTGYAGNLRSSITPLYNDRSTEVASGADIA